MKGQRAQYQRLSQGSEIRGVAVGDGDRDCPETFNPNPLKPKPSNPKP